MKIAAGFRKSRRAEISNIFLSPLGNIAKVVLYPLFILRSRHVRSANAPLRKANACNVLVCLYIYSINKSQSQVNMFYPYPFIFAKLSWL